MSMTAVKSVDPRSPARRAGVRAGETLTHINGHPIVDVLDYKFYGYDPRLELTLKAPDGAVRTLRVRKSEGEDLGLEFETYLMDRARSCANHCIFCFVDQMPPGMRPSLYFKDDDARLSFLLGNYLTLTNLSPREVQRIIDLRISPINVSVHTTDRALRCEMLKNKRAGEGIDIMERLAAHNITMNCQIVSCPGINDGPALDKTLSDLAAMFPAVNSVSVVPVGVTKYREGLYPLKTYTKETAAALLGQVEAFAARHLADKGTRLVWCSDEFYLLAGRELPEEDYFEDFTQLDNGVGMLTLLMKEFGRALDLMDSEELEGPPLLHRHRSVRRPLFGKISGTSQGKMWYNRGEGLPHRQPLLRGDHHRGRTGHRGRPDRPAPGQRAGTAAAHPRQHAPVRGKRLSGRYHHQRRGAGAGRACDPRPPGRLRAAGRHLRGSAHP